MPRDEHPSPPGASRRAFLRACAATTAAAALPALGCSGPQDSREAPRLAEVAPRAEPPAAAPPAPAAPRSPWLAALREVSLAEGLEPATVFVAAVEE